MFSEKLGIVEIPEERSIDIDTLWDFKIASLINSNLKKMKNFALKNLLKNKKIFITGASGKLGSMMSYNLGLLGAELILTDFFV